MSAEIRQMLARDPQPKYRALVTPEAIGWGYEIEIQINGGGRPYWTLRSARAWTSKRAERKARRIMATLMAEDAAEREAKSRRRVIEP